MNLLHQLDSPLMRRALLEVVVVGALCGAVGVHVVIRRLPFFAFALAHATFPGVAIAAAIGVNLFVGGGVATAVVVASVAAIGSARRLDQSTATGIVLAGAFATGVLVQSARPGGSKDLAAFLVGDVLTVSPATVTTTIVVAAVVVIVFAALAKELSFTAFDPAGATAAGYSTAALELVVLGGVAVAVVTAVPAVGTILVVTLLVAPALAARQWTHHLGRTTMAAAVIGALSGVTGLAASAQWDTAAGASVALSAVAYLALATTGAAVVDRRRRARIRAGAALAAAATSSVATSAA